MDLCVRCHRAFIYLPPFDSHFYDNKTYRGIKLLESLLLELSQVYDYELIICGDLNARVGTLSEIIEADINRRFSAILFHVPLHNF